MPPIWDINLRHLRALSVVARLGSISAAAQAVSISQPAITQAIAKLEAQCGLPFFERQPRGMVGTEAGLIFVQRVDSALRQIGSPKVTATQMRALIALADHGSYPAASAATGLAQPSLHRAINDLSLVLRRTLTERRGRGIALTEDGRRIVRAFRLARGELETGLAELAGLLGRETGRIVIGAMPLSRARILPAALATFHHEHPEVVIEVLEGAFHDLIEPLRDGAIDLMIGALRDPTPGPDIEQHTLFADRPMVIGRKGHPLSSPAIAELARYPWIVPSRGTPLRKAWERMFAGIEPQPRVPIECGSAMVIRQLLIGSDFLTLLSPDQVAVELEAEWLAMLAETPPDLTRVIGITCRAGWRPTAVQSCFIRILRQQAG